MSILIILLKKYMQVLFNDVSQNITSKYRKTSHQNTAKHHIKIPQNITSKLILKEKPPFVIYQMVVSLFG